MKLDELIEQHRDAVYRQMVRVCGNYDDAEDVLMEALEKAYLFSNQLKDARRFRAWLAKIGTRLCYRLKSGERMRTVILGEGVDPDTIAAREPSPQEELETESLKECIKNALDQMPDAYRQVYILREIEGKSGEETAQELAISLEAMKSRLHRARAWMRDHMDEALSCF